MITRSIVAGAALIVAAALSSGAAPAQEEAPDAPDTPAETTAPQQAAPDQVELPFRPAAFSCPPGCRVNVSSSPIDYANLVDAASGAAGAAADGSYCAFTTATLTTYSCAAAAGTANPVCLLTPPEHQIDNPRMIEVQATTPLGPCDTSMFRPQLRYAKDDVFLNEGTLLKPGLCPDGDRCAPLYVGNIFTGNGQLDVPGPAFLALGDDSYLSGRLPEVDRDQRYEVRVVSRNPHGEAATAFNLIVLDVE